MTKYSKHLAAVLPVILGGILVAGGVVMDKINGVKGFLLTVVHISINKAETSWRQ